MLLNIIYRCFSMSATLIINSSFTFIFCECEAQGKIWRMQWITSKITEIWIFCLLHYLVSPGLCCLLKFTQYYSLLEPTRFLSVTLHAVLFIVWTHTFSLRYIACSIIHRLNPHVFSLLHYIECNKEKTCGFRRWVLLWGINHYASTYNVCGLD